MHLQWVNLTWKWHGFEMASWGNKQEIFAFAQCKWTLKACLQIPTPHRQVLKLCQWWWAVWEAKWVPPPFYLSDGPSVLTNVNFDDDGVRMCKQTFKSPFTPSVRVSLCQHCDDAWDTVLKVTSHQMTNFRCVIFYFWLFNLLNEAFRTFRGNALVLCHN